ncbi:MAG: hypothetical protein GXY45_10555 [Ramlibacter sp.]|nr:hypothetical protein [Ramlibacter sp.]
MSSNPNTRRYPRQMSEAFPAAADRSGLHHDDQRGPSHWPATLIFIAAIVCAVLIAILGGNPHA